MPQKRAWRKDDACDDISACPPTEAGRIVRSSLGERGIDLGKTSPTSPPVADAQGLWKQGAAALRAGRPRDALAAFKHIIDAGRADATVWFGAAMALSRTGDAAGTMRALDEVLARSPRDIRALMMKADHLEAAGDPVAASSYHWAVMRLGEAGEATALDLAAEVRRAEAAVARHNARFEAHIVKTLQARGLGGAGTRRVAESVELMLGRREVFLQQPVQYYFPELPQMQFYDREDTPWLDGVEAATDDIRRELLDVLADEGAFRPYVEPTPDRPFFDRDGLLGNPDWTAFYLVKSGTTVAENAARCPKTMAALADVPMCEIPALTPSVLFSLLRPGARIPPHHGLLNTRLICHLPLIVPGGCGFRVGSETRAWVEGRAWAFDDSIEHEAWNDGDRARVVLIFDVWRPELTKLERELVSALLQASPAFQRADRVA